jgi:hypothetical protein
MLLPLSLIDCVGSRCRQNVRYDWTEMANTIRLLFACFWLDDDFHLRPILSDLSLPKLM